MLVITERLRAVHKYAQLPNDKKEQQKWQKICFNFLKTSSINFIKNG